MTPDWILKPFDELSPFELYTILQLRNEVFVVEQQCVFQDADDRDQPSRHLMAWTGSKLVAYTRLVPPRLVYQYPSIGRVVTSPRHRREGYGRELMNRSITEVRRLYGVTPIQIGAQLYLKDFYASFGFRESGEIYLEDGIPHIEMIRNPAR